MTGLTQAFDDRAQKLIVLRSCGEGGLRTVKQAEYKLGGLSTAAAAGLFSDAPSQFEL